MKVVRDRIRIPNLCTMLRALFRTSSICLEIGKDVVANIFFPVRASVRRAMLVFDGISATIEASPACRHISWISLKNSVDALLRVIASSAVRLISLPDF